MANVPNLWGAGGEGSQVPRPSCGELGNLTRVRVTSLGQIFELASFVPVLGLKCFIPVVWAVCSPVVRVCRNLSVYLRCDRIPTSNLFNF